MDIRKKKVASMEVTSEEVQHDGKMLKKLVDRASENNDISRVLADGAYDSRENLLSVLGRPRHRCCNQGKEEIVRQGSRLLSKEVSGFILQQLADFDKWKASVSYGHRWIVESVFSAMKRMFGEYVMARKYQNMVKEMFLKVCRCTTCSQI